MCHRISSMCVFSRNIIIIFPNGIGKSSIFKRLESNNYWGSNSSSLDPINWAKEDPASVFIDDVFLVFDKTCHPVQDMTDLGLPRNVLIFGGSRMEGSASMIPILQTNKKTTTNKNITQQPPYKNAAVALMDTSVELPAVKKYKA